MPGPETIRDYLDTVAAQIRWKRARAVAVRELGTHLEDQRADFLAEGKDEGHAWKLSRYAEERLRGDIKDIIRLAGSQGKA